MKTNRLILIAAVLALAGCTAKAPVLKSMKVQYPARPDYTETYNFRYDSQGRLVQTEECSIYEGEKHIRSWKYTYKDGLKAEVETKLMRRSHKGEILFQDDYNHIASISLPEETEMDENGIVFLGQLWEHTYKDGRLARAVFADFTSDGTAVSKFTWDGDELVKYEGSDPALFTEIKDIEYLETENPFNGPDPVAYLLEVEPFFWQGLAGPRPDKLIGAYTHVASDPWVEDISMDQVSISYETDRYGRITHILQTINGKLEKSVELSY